MKIVNLIFLIFLFTGCSFTNPRKTQGNNKPYWFYQANQNSRIGGIGASNKYGKSHNEKLNTAIQDALNNIAMQNKVTISSVRELREKGNINHIETELNSYSIATVEGVSISAIVRDTWVDKVRGEIYVWMQTYRDENEKKQIIKEIEEEEAKKTIRTFLNLTREIKEMKIEGFQFANNDVELTKQKQVENDYLVSAEIGIAIGSSEYFLIGGIFDNSPLEIYKLGLGTSYRIYNFHKLDLNLALAIEGLFIQGEIGRSFSKDSIIKVKTNAYGFTPSFRIAYNFNPNIKVFFKTSYSFFQNIDDFSYRTDEFQPSISFNGLGLALGFSVSF